MRDWILATKHNPCHCGGTDWCRRSPDGKAVLCRRTDIAPPGWIRGSQPKDGQGYIFHLKDNNFDREIWLADQERRREARKAEETRHRAESPPAGERDRLYRQLLDQLPLEQFDRNNLERRGLTPEQIKLGMFRTVRQWQKLETELPHTLPGVNLDGVSLNTQAGNLCPIFNPEGLIVGFQIRFHSTEHGKYKWLSSKTKNRPNGARPHLPNGELPIAFCNPFSLLGKPSGKSIGLAEGILKPFIIAQKQQQIVLGCPSANFASSPEQFKEYLEAASNITGSKNITLFPDGAGFSNKAIKRNYVRAIKLAEKWGYTVKIAWWGQFDKTSPDGDELTDEYIELLTLEEVEELHNNNSTLYPITQPFNRIHKRYVTPEIIQKYTKDIYNALICLKSAKGTGKTFLLRELMKPFPKILYISARNNLLRSIAKELGLVHHLDYEGDYNKFDRLAITYDSLYKLRPECWVGALIVFDEAVQGFEHYTCSGTIKKQKTRHLIQAVLEAIVKVSGMSLFLDANLSDTQINYAFAISGNKEKTIILNSAKPRKGDYTVIDAPNYTALIPMIIKDLAEGKRLVITSDSKEVIKDICSFIGRELPQVKYYAIHGDNSGSPECKHFLENLNQEILNIQCLLISPSVDCGVSIESTANIDRVYGIAMGGSTPHWSFSQSLDRYRGTCERILWINPKRIGAYKEENPLKIKSDAMDNWKDEGLTISHFDPEALKWIASEQNKPFIDLHCQCKADKHKSLNNFREGLIVHLEEEGHNITYREIEKDDYLTDLKKDIRDERKQKHNEAVANAELIDTSTAINLENQTYTSEEDRDKVLKYRLKEDFDTDVTPELVKADDNGKLRANYSQLYYLTRSFDVVAYHSKKNREENKFIFDCRHDAIKRDMRKAMDLDKFLDPEFTWVEDSPEVQEIKAYCQHNAPNLKVKLGVLFTKKMTGCQIVGILLDQLGLKTISKRGSVDAAGKRVRTYQLDPTRWELFQQYAAIRDKRWELLKAKEQSLSTPVGETVQVPTEELTSTPPYINKLEGGVDAEEPMGMRHLPRVGARVRVNVGERYKPHGKLGTVQGIKVQGGIPWYQVQLEVDASEAWLREYSAKAEWLQPA